MLRMISESCPLDFGPLWSEAEKEQDIFYPALMLLFCFHFPSIGNRQQGIVDDKFFRWL